MKKLILNFLYPDFDCVDCNGMAWQYGACECSYHHAVAPGVGPSKLIRFLRRVHTFLTSPAWMNEPSVVAEWSRTMRGASYLRAWELVDYSDVPSIDLVTQMTAIKWNLNSTYGRNDAPRWTRDHTGDYLRLNAMRQELRSRGESGHVSA